MRLNETELDGSAHVSKREEDATAPTFDSGADTRAMAAVGAGRVGSLDHGGMKSLQRLAGNGAVMTALQREAGGDEVPAQRDIATRIGASTGSPLPAATQAAGEHSYGTDMSHVRVHEGGEAQSLSKDLGAHAFTTGSDIFLGAGQSSTDLNLMGHEMGHVVQQAAGPVSTSTQRSSVGVSDPGDRFEVEASAAGAKVAAGEKVNLGTIGHTAQRDDDHAGESASEHAAHAQRAAAPDEQVQELAINRLAVQRDAPAGPAAPEEEPEAPAAATAQALHIQREEGGEPEE